MEPIIFATAFITAGAALIAGLINLFVGMHKDGEKIDVLFGILALLVLLFIVVPPAGFITKVQAPYPFSFYVKCSFLWAHYLLLPWFISYYSNYHRKKLSLVINGLLAVAFVLMVSTEQRNDSPNWIWFMLVPLTLIWAQGMLAARHQKKQGKSKEAKWLFTAMLIYGLLLFAGVLYQTNQDQQQTGGIRIFFPFNLNLLTFVCIISFRLRNKLFEKYHIIKKLNQEQTQWNSLLNAAQLLIVALDKDGNISFVNPYTVKTLGYHSASELLNQNWFEKFPMAGTGNTLKALYTKTIQTQQTIANFLTEVRTKDGTGLKISWTNMLMYDEDGKLKGTMNIGNNITDKEDALMQLKLLKNELEKESLPSTCETSSQIMETGIIGQSNAVLYALQKARKVADTNASVLLNGETGVGKEIFAHFIHSHSFRSDKQFIKINCAALPPELIESELFGHEKGAFTGALQARKGRFELAHKGTIFLDEIGEMPLSVQPKLLRVLQSGEFERIGGQQTIKVDVRIIAATNRELSREVVEGHFREDLFYRLNVFPITIPPLRKRPGDIPLLVGHFVRTISAEHNKQITDVSKADMTRLCEYKWPGNIRELMNVIQRSVISSEGHTLRLEGLNNQNPVNDDTTIVSSSTIEEVEKNHILKILEECNGRINGESGAANRLGLHPSTLRSRLKKLNIYRENL
ncbi:sigma 54-interacting transcriptional regulator [Danxiaibacter flavus]|uniref:Sigma 54-interacting transcriptional regulator n=1 Tax=Danxiaibacter flavus TaxID=3049108 RepID=A0ABV3ZJ14_9BACT|nr:sigma 54-interacting transcriptional regulator [Chitinophagaceae bacterium DXS]